MLWPLGRQGPGGLPDWPMAHTPYDYWEQGPRALPRFKFLMEKYGLQ